MPRIIPCLDVNEGRVVKGTNFLNLRDAGDPVEVATRYEKEGADVKVPQKIVIENSLYDSLCMFEEEL